MRGHCSSVLKCVRKGVKERMVNHSSGVRGERGGEKKVKRRRAKNETERFDLCVGVFKVRQSE